MKPTGWLKTEKHRQLVERWWIGIVVVWDILKTVSEDAACIPAKPRVAIGHGLIKTESPRASAAFHTGSRWSPTQQMFLRKIGNEGRIVSFA